MYLHLLGHRDPVELATALHAALAASKTPFAAAPAGTAPSPIDLDTVAIDQAAGKNGDGVYQFGIPRTETINGGMVVPPAMGSAIVINFQPTGGGRRRSPATSCRSPAK